MTEDPQKARSLTTPRSAAIAGMIFAVFLATSIVLMRLSISDEPVNAGTWLSSGHRTAATVAINLVPFAGIAFLWFMGVMRDRMGEREDKFFATVFMGSGLLFVAMLFASAAMAIGLIAMFKAAPATNAQNEVWMLGNKVTFALLNVFAIRMAAVFMISTSTIALRTSFISRWLAFLGMGIALILLVASNNIPYLSLMLPLWVFLVSLFILTRSRSEARAMPESV